MHRIDILLPVGSRTISVTEDAYERLRRMKKPGESFSDVIRRITRGRSLLELATIMPPEGARKVAEAIERARAEQMAIRRRELGLDR
jgi:predicted CopG family antitoxin